MRLTNTIANALVIVLTACGIVWFGYSHYYFNRTPIKVGILHSLTGIFAPVEKLMVQGTLLAIDELNSKGGVLGSRIEPIIVDAQSEVAKFYTLAQKLIAQDQVGVIFGCYTSASRKTVKPLFEKYNHLLMYPVFYEGLEYSPNIVYVGATANQQCLPGVKWCFDNVGTKFFITGTESIYSRIATQEMKDQIASLGGTVVGELYINASQTQITAEQAQTIVEAKPEVILNNFESYVFKSFFTQLKRAKLSNEKVPIMSFVSGETDLIDPENMFLMAGSYVTWNYVESIPTDNNQLFVQEFKRAYGPKQVVGDLIECAYTAVKLWAQAVEKAGTASVDKVRMTIVDQSLYAPNGTVYVDPPTRHLWKTVRVGKIRSNGQFSIIWDSKKPVAPVPYPLYRTRQEWEAIQQSYYKQWNNQWAKS